MAHEAKAEIDDTGPENYDAEARDHEGKGRE